MPAMAGDELRERDPDVAASPTVDRLRHRLRAIAIVVVLALLFFRVTIPPVIQVLTGGRVLIDDDGAVLFTLAGTLLVLLGLEVPSFLNGGRK